MSDTEIQFDQVQRPAAATCSVCGGSLFDSYFQANGRILCEPCATKLRNHFASSAGAPGRFLKAIGLGLGGGILGGAVYTAVLTLANFNVALITILIGWLVGKGVRHGSGGRGGVGFQILAVAITYWIIGLSIMASAIFGGAANGRDPIEIAVVCAIAAFKVPILSVSESPIGGFITLFGMMQAWRMNVPAKIAITGPHAIAGIQSAAATPTAPTPAATPALPRFEPPVPPSA